VAAAKANRKRRSRLFKEEQKIDQQLQEIALYSTLKREKTTTLSTAEMDTTTLVLALRGRKKSAHATDHFFCELFVSLLVLV
jgi:hypothetical protein